MNPLHFLRRRVFISYSGDAVEFARVLAARLESAGYRAVLDKWDLQPGSAYDASLKRLVENSALLIFVVSARSVRPDAYALTELAWAVAARRPILGVYPSSDIGVIAPADVRARTLIQREGDPIALTVGEASRIVGAPSALLGKAGMLTLAVVLVITVWSLTRQRLVEQQPPQQAAPALSRPSPHVTSGVPDVADPPVVPGTVPSPAETPDFRIVLLNEDFSDNRQQWPGVSDRRRRFGVSGGRYAMSSSTLSGSTATISVPIKQESDYQIRCRVTKRSGVPNFFFGLIWGKSDEDNFFDFAITGEGTVAIAKKERGQFEDFIEADVVDRNVNKGNETNLLVLRKEAQRMRFYVNGHLVHEMSPPRFFGDGVGFMIYNVMDVEFDDLVITTTSD